MNATKIDWDHGDDLPLFTWNPVTGCLHKCRLTYCYAAGLAHDFSRRAPADPQVLDALRASGDLVETRATWQGLDTWLHELNKPAGCHYPFVFGPTLHAYRLCEPELRKKPARIFVVSMGDLFGGWVPMRWIELVLEACRKAPQHEYVFLSKWPERYVEVDPELWPPSRWLGATATGPVSLARVSVALDAARAVVFNATGREAQRMISLEPLHFQTRLLTSVAEWIIVGGQTGPGSIKPAPDWVDLIRADCARFGIYCTVKANVARAEAP